MEERGKASSNTRMHAMILLVLGLILLVVGVAIVTIPGFPMRGSGLGTISLVLGVLLLVVSFLRFSIKRT